CQILQPAMPTISAGPLIKGSSLLATLHDSRPTLDHNWRVRINNNGSTTRSDLVLGLCKDSVGAHVVVGSPTDNPPLTQTQAAVRCDTGVPLGGGIGASSDSTLVSVNSSYPVDGGWEAFENNESLQDDTVRAWVVCSS